MIEAYKGLLGRCKAAGSGGHGGGGVEELVPVLEHWLGVLWRVYEDDGGEFV